MTRPFEKVYSMTSYYDGPRIGVADFDGLPHLYESEWNDSEGDGDPIYRLSSIDAETLSLVEESWDIWLRWERARHDGETAGEDHSALPGDRARHDELERLLAKRLVTASNPTRASGNFRRARDLPWDGKGHSPPLEVQWTPVQKP